MIAAVAVLLVNGCMTGPVPVSPNHRNDNPNPLDPTEDTLPGAPTHDNATP